MEVRATKDELPQKSSEHSEEPRAKAALCLWDDKLLSRIQNTDFEAERQALASCIPAAHEFFQSFHLICTKIDKTFFIIHITS